VDDDDGDDDGQAAGPRALLAKPVSPSRLPVARSLADAVPGEIVVVNRRGQSMTTRQVNASKAAYWAILVAGPAAIGVTYGALLSPTVGVIAALAIQLLALSKMRHWPALRTAIAHAASYRWEEAHAALIALEHKRLPALQRQTVQALLASIEHLLGQPQQALDRLTRAQAEPGAARGQSHVLRCQVAALKAETLATLGRFEEARRARDELGREAAAATGAADRPRGDYLDMLVQGTELKIAADADAPDALPDDNALHGWARAALGRSRFGDMLVSLAWAFHRRGDDDMARHLLAEAPSRIPRSSLPQTSPRLHAFAQEKAREWGIDAIAEPRPR
jgi:hypothetical protein